MRQMTVIVVSMLAVAAVAAGAQGPVVQSSVQKTLEKGYRLAEEKKNVEAVAAFQSVLTVEPKNHAARVSLGYLYAEGKQWKSAVKNFKTAAAQDPADQRLRMDLAYALQGAGDLDGAAGEFAHVAVQEGEFKAQAQAAVENLKNGSSSASALKGRQKLERGYAALSRGDRAAARVQFEAAAKADPKSSAALKQLGFLNFEDGKLQEASRDFEAVRILDPHDYFTALQLGYTYERMKKADEARAAFTVASMSADAKIRDAAVAALKPATVEATNPSL